MSDESEVREPGWWRLSVLGWLAHVALGLGVFARASISAPYWHTVFDLYKMALPSLTSLVHPAAHGLAGPNGPWVMGGLAVFDLIMLLALERHARPLWKWWFWGIAIVLMLFLPTIEFAYQLPARKLIEAGLPLP